MFAYFQISSDVQMELVKGGDWENKDLVSECVNYMQQAQTELS